MAATLPRVAAYTGSFDPFHKGHENIVRRASGLFDRLLVGVGENPEKSPLFTAQDRVAMIAGVLGVLPNVEVHAFRGLTVKFARARGAKVLLRGIRALSDIEYEFTMTLTNSNLDASLETVFLMACKEYSHLSSSLIRQVAQFGGDLSHFVPAAVQERLIAKFASAGKS